MLIFGLVILGHNPLIARSAKFADYWPQRTTHSETPGRLEGAESVGSIVVITIIITKATPSWFTGSSDSPYSSAPNLYFSPRVCQTFQEIRFASTLVVTRC